MPCCFFAASAQVVPVLQGESGMEVLRFLLCTEGVRMPCYFFAASARVVPVLHSKFGLELLWCFL